MMAEPHKYDNMLHYIYKNDSDWQKISGHDDSGKMRRKTLMRIVDELYYNEFYSLILLLAWNKRNSINVRKASNITLLRKLHQDWTDEEVKSVAHTFHAVIHDMYDRHYPQENAETAQGFVNELRGILKEGIQDLEDHKVSPANEVFGRLRNDPSPEEK